MRWLKRLRLFPGEPDDHGAVAVMVAVLLSSGVLLGLGALVIDVGLIADEREQLQTGADAGAWAVAEDCLVSPDACGGRAGTTAGRFARDNTRDGSAGANTVVCTGSCPGESLTRTPPCPDLPDGFAGPFTEVRTTTENDDGSTLLPPRLAQAMAGGDYRGTEVAACAQVTWGPPSTLSVFGLAMSVCDFEAAGGTFHGVRDMGAGSGAIPVRLEPPAAAVDRGVPANSGGDPACESGDGPQGAVWLAGTDGEDCTVAVPLGQVRAGTPAPACRTRLQDAHTRRVPLLVALFDDVAAATDYDVVGFAAFVPTGWRDVPGLSDARSWLREDLGVPQQPECPTAQPGPVVPPVPEDPDVIGTLPDEGDDVGTLPTYVPCYFGYFTRMFAPRTPPAPQAAGAADYGVSVLGRIG